MGDLFGSEGANLEGIQTMGIVNSLKTGNVMIDMTIAMLIPIVIGCALSWVSKFQTYVNEVDWSKLFKKKCEYHERHISHSAMITAYSTTDLGGDSQNELLIKAIQLYLDAEGLLKLKTAELELRQIGEDEQKNNYYYYGNDDENSTTLADTLSKYKVIKKPLKDLWLTLGKHGHEKDQHEITLMVQENKEDVNNKDGGSAQHKHDIKLHFKSEGKDAIDVFIDKAYKWYLDQLRTLEDETRYLYELKQPGGKSDDGDEASDRKFKRYQLSDEKTFESLFFNEKETILKIVANFTNKTGKYAIKGYPNKLGLLLHGPPGTGKVCDKILNVLLFLCRESLVA